MSFLESNNTLVINSFIQDIYNLRVYKNNKHGTALKKPLLVLLLLAKIERGEVLSNRIHFCEIEDELNELIKKYAYPRSISNPKPEQPFYHLSSANFWELKLPDNVNKDLSKTLSIKSLRKPDVYGYFESNLFNILIKDKEVRAKLIRLVVDTWWQNETGKQILNYLGLPEKIVKVEHKELQDSSFNDLINIFYKNKFYEENGGRQKMDEHKMSHIEFFKKAILRLRDTSKSNGIHSIYSGFNEAFREYYQEDPIKVTQELVRLGEIEVRPRKGGVMIYLPGEAPDDKRNMAKNTLKKILTDD